MKKLTDEELKKAFRYWLTKYTAREAEEPLGPFFSAATLAKAAEAMDKKM